MSISALCITHGFTINAVAVCAAALAVRPVGSVGAVIDAHRVLQLHILSTPHRLSIMCKYDRTTNLLQEQANHTDDHNPTAHNVFWLGVCIDNGE